MIIARILRESDLK